MPRVPDQLLECVVYLYPSEEAARHGERRGGTGFVVRRGDRHFLISNQHVTGPGNRFARVNVQGGGVDVLEVSDTEFVTHGRGEDISACVLPVEASWSLVPLDWDTFYGSHQAFEDRMRELNVGIGDETIMVGRFVAHDGRATNKPLARFGRIAMIPGGERVMDARGIKTDAYLVEMVSLPGFSGSPVFIYIPPASFRQTTPRTMMPFFEPTVGLLGIDVGHKQVTGKVYDAEGEVVEEYEVRHNSGVAIVVPTVKIEELLDQPELAEGDEPPNC